MNIQVQRTDLIQLQWLRAPCDSVSQENKISLLPVPKKIQINRLDYLKRFLFGHVQEKYTLRDAQLPK